MNQTPSAQAGPPRVELRGITKIYPSVVANSDISFAAWPGEIHAVLGENGAGKSTLMKIIYGVVKPDAGEVLWEGRPSSSRIRARARPRHRDGVPALLAVRDAHRRRERGARASRDARRSRRWRSASSRCRRSTACLSTRAGLVHSLSVASASAWRSSAACS
jgi:ABC-type cobalamin/Fe3+-siderophores transport system ATPase subunit